MSVAADSDYIKQLAAVIGEEAAASVVAAMPNSMYNVCKGKVQALDEALDSKPLYSDFESAMVYYEQYGIVAGTSQDVIEFNDLMEFVYIGRRKKEKEIAVIPEEDYIISQIVVIPPELWELGNY